MAMTKIREILQYGLRRKFGWSTNTNYNHDTILVKEDTSTQLDICVKLDDYQIRQEILKGDGHGVEISLHKYAINNKDGTYTELESLTGDMSLAELELIYKIAKEKELEIYRNIKNIKEINNKED